MTRQAGGIGAAIRSSYQQGRYDEAVGLREEIDLIRLSVGDAADCIELRFQRLEDQIAQNKIVLQYLVDNKVPRVENE